MSNPSDSTVQNLLPVQAYFDVDGNFQTFIGQGKPFTATIDPDQSGLHITDSTIDSSVIGGITPAAAHFTTGTVSSSPSAPTDIANKQYVDYYAAGLSWKEPVLTATSADITLSGLQTINGVTLTDGDRVLVKNQATSSENGIYIAHSTAWTYAVGADNWSEYVGAIVFIVEGSLSGTAWYCTAQPGGTLGVTAMVWSNFSVASSYTAGTGLTLTGTQFSITNTGLAAATYGSASSIPVITFNAQGQATNVVNTTVTPALSSITGFGTDVATALAVNVGSAGSILVNGGALGTPASGNFSSGTFTWPTFNQNTTGTAAGLSATLAIGSGGTGQTTASAAFNALSPITSAGDLIIGNGANSATRLAIGANSYVLTSNGTTATWAALPAGMVYPGAGIPNSTGSAWGTSYSTTGSGTVVALATSPSFTTPSLGVATGTSLQVTGGIYSTSSSSFTFTDGIVVDYTTGTGRFSVGSSDGFAWYNGGVASSSIMALSSAGILSGATWQGATVAVGYGGTGVTTLTGLAYGNGASAFTAATAAQVVSVIGSTAVTNATNATNSTNIAITDDTTTNATVYPTWVTTTTGNLPAKTASTKLSFNPSTGALTATSFSGSGANLTSVVNSITGTSNQVTASASTGAVTLSLPQSIATSSSVQFGSFGVGTAASGTTGEIRATNNVTAYYSSDAKFKENVRQIDNAVEKTIIIGGKYFDWTAEYIANKGGADGYFVRKNDIGVIAQDVEKVLPEAVRTREDGTLAVDYQKLVSLAFAAIAELKAEIDSLKGN